MSVNGTKDPLLLSGPEKQRELFRRFSEAADGFPIGDVISASANMLINSIRQSQPSRRQAELRFDELFGRCKQVLVDHYDSLGRKRGIFPFDQIVEMHHFDARRKRG